MEKKAENKFTATSGLPACVCVCVLCRLDICTCVFQCVVCAIKNLTKVLIITLSNWLASPSPCEGAAHTTTNKLSVIQPTYFNTMPQLVELTTRLRVVLKTMSHLPIRPIHRLMKNATVRRAQPQNFI